MNTKFEEKDEITVEEYKAWLAGFMYGGDTPNRTDVELIIKMTNKIVPDVREAQNPYAPIVVPYTPVTDEPAPWWETQPTCTDDVEYLNGITITSGTTSMEFKDSGDITINGHSSLADGITIADGTGVSYGCYGGSFASSYAPPQPATFDAPAIMEDNEVEASEILNEIRRRSQTKMVSSGLGGTAKERLAEVKRRLKK